MDSVDVTALCKACVDLVVPVGDAELADFGVAKGHGLRVKIEKAQKLFARLAPRGKIMPGGVGANSMAAVGALGGNAAFIGKVGDDSEGRLFAAAFQDHGVAFAVKPYAGQPTACVFVLVTPDAERSIIVPASSGAADYLTKADVDANQRFLERSRIVFLGIAPRMSGYAPLIGAALRHAPQARIAATLQGFGEQKLSSAYVISLASAGIIVGNEEEFARFLPYLGAANVEAAAKAHPDKIFACTLGEKGARIAAGSRIVEIPARPIHKIVDTTGAGDAWAGGFLLGLARSLPLEAAAELGADAAWRILSESGGRPTRPWKVAAPMIGG